MKIRDLADGDSVLYVSPGEYYSLAIALQHFVTDFEESDTDNVLVGNAYKMLKEIKANG
jgi:hypothetical protein